ncbi:MAG TPA: hypothetical protein PLQ13_04245 [Candidatus Krumholzibacteria bacterium]|nr:hypothetical protein [Candidatus Krumholzibacteria bacterium]
MIRRLGYAVPVLVVAILGFLPVLRSWWLHDDWYFLADALGLGARPGSLVRPVSYQLYWSLLVPLFGLAPWPWALTRLALHAASALMVARLARRAGLDAAGAAAAGAIFAAAPVAFESLCWGTGAVELLGAFLALAALDRWLAGDGRSRGLALVLAGLAVGAKESGLFLAPVFAWTLHRESRLRSWAGAGTVVLAAVGVGAALLVRRDVAATAAYALDLRHALRNGLVFGAWLLTPGPLLRDATLTSRLGAVLGSLAWLLWVTAVQTVRPDRRRAAAAALVLGVLALVPALVTGDHAVPRYLYASFAAVAVTVALMLYPQRGPSRGSLTLLTVLLVTSALGTTLYHRDARHPSGRPLHRLVFKEEVSRLACRAVVGANLGPGDRVVFLRDPATDDAQWALMQDVLGGDRAVRVLTRGNATAAWRDHADPSDRGAFVFVVRGAMLAPAGRAGAPAP